MALSEVVAKIVEWLRAGYPHGVPEHDYIPLLALLTRRLGHDEVIHVIESLIEHGVVPADRVDVGVAITKLTHEMPLESDLERVRKHLVAHGWPIDEEWAEK